VNVRQVLYKHSFTRLQLTNYCASFISFYIFSVLKCLNVYILRYIYQCTHDSQWQTLLKHSHSAQSMRRWFSPMHFTLVFFLKTEAVIKVKVYRLSLLALFSYLPSFSKLRCFYKPLAGQLVSAHLFVFTVQCHMIPLPSKRTENRKRECLWMEKGLSRINIITVGVIFTVYEACGKAVTGHTGELMCSAGHLESGGLIGRGSVAVAQRGSCTVMW